MSHKILPSEVGLVDAFRSHDSSTVSCHIPNDATVRRWIEWLRLTYAARKREQGS